jgi:aminoglycoside N3'-acetyltransferase
VVLPTGRVRRLQLISTLFEGTSDSWLETAGRQRRGIVGHAEARLARSRHIVEAALARLRENETVFLHSAGLCEECDAARVSLAQTRD